MSMKQSRIKVVVVGLNFGRWVINNEILATGGSPYIELVGVFDLDKEKTALAANDYMVRAYDSLEEVLKDDQVEAIVLMTGPSNRGALIRQILEANKHVMTTKPFDLSYDSAAQALSVAKEKNLVLHVNSPAPVMPPDLALIQQWAKDYDLGRPISYCASTYCNYREESDGSWYDDPKSCPVAPIFRLGIYLIHDVSYFFTKVKSVSAQSAKIFTQRPTPDNAQLSIIYEDGSLGNIYSSFCIEDGQVYRCSLEIHFERGTCYRNVGPSSIYDGNQICLKLATIRDGQPIVIEEAANNGGAGYNWEFFQSSIADPNLRTIRNEDTILSGVRIIQLMQEQSN